MKWTSNISSLIKEVELRKNPVIIRVNKFDEDAAKKFAQEMAQAHNTGQKVIPVVIDSYGGQVYSLMSMISAIRHSTLPVATIVIFIPRILSTLSKFISGNIMCSLIPKVKLPL